MGAQLKLRLRDRRMIMIIPVVDTKNIIIDIMLVLGNITKALHLKITTFLRKKEKEKYWQRIYEYSNIPIDS